jgi:hypothetical protein
MPNDEALAYLATQAVADFLATERKMKLDGLIFPAVQASGGGRNVVLFHKAGRAKPLELPPETKIEATLNSQDEDGWHREYSVIEETPPAKPASAPIPSTILDFKTILSLPFPPKESQWDDRLETLQIAETEIEIHIVRSVRFKTEKHSVRRYRWEARAHLDL